jgi:hypothetical protein
MKQRLEKYSERFDNDKSAIGNTDTWGKRMVDDVPKQDEIMERFIINAKQKETLEEVAERLYPNYQQEIFIKGAKWQQERSYSDEDLKEAFNKGFYTAYGCKSEWIERIEIFFNEWFKQFKNK